MNPLIVQNAEIFSDLSFSVSFDIEAQTSKIWPYLRHSRAGNATWHADYISIDCWWTHPQREIWSARSTLCQSQRHNHGPIDRRSKLSKHNGQPFRQLLENALELPGRSIAWKTGDDGTQTIWRVMNHSWRVSGFLNWEELDPDAYDTPVVYPSQQVHGLPSTAAMAVNSWRLWRSQADTSHIISASVETFIHFGWVAIWASGFV